MNKNNKTIKITALILSLFVIVFVVVSFILGTSTLKPTTADITNFKVGDAFDVSVNRDIIVHDDENNADNLIVYFSAKNFGPEVDNKIEVQNTTGYDDNTPTADQLSEEEQENLTNEEIEKINEKTINEANKRLNNKRTAGEFIDISAIQDKHALLEPDYLERVGAGNATNLDSLHKGAESGSSYDFYVAFTLNNMDKVTLLVRNYSSENNDNFEINFDIAKHFSFKKHQANEPVQKSNHENNYDGQKIEFRAANITLVDGWYVDTQAQSIVQLKNDRFEKGSIDINYSSSDSALQLAQETASWSQPAPEISEIKIGNKDYYYFTKSDGYFVLCTTGKSNLPLRIMCSGITLDDAKPIIESLSFM